MTAGRSRSDLGWIVLRVVAAGIVGAHGWARLLAGGVDPFGKWLDLQGFPLGHAIAWGITLIEMVGAPLFALGRWVFPLSIAYASIYTVGIGLIHVKAGWFVVGLGRNGMEFSVLLIVALLCVGAQHALRKEPAQP